MKRKYQKKTSAGFVRSMIAGITIGAVVTVLGILLTTGAVVTETLEEGTLRYIIPIIQALSVFIGSYIAGKRITDRKIGVIIACAALYSFLLMAITIIFYDGVFQNFAYGLISVLAGMMLSIVLNIRQKSASKVRKHKMRNC